MPSVEMPFLIVSKSSNEADFADFHVHNLMYMNGI